MTASYQTWQPAILAMFRGPSIWGISRLSNRVNSVDVRINEKWSGIRRHTTGWLVGQGKKPSEKWWTSSMTGWWRETLYINGKMPNWWQPVTTNQTSWGIVDMFLAGTELSSWHLPIKNPWCPAGLAYTRGTTSKPQRWVVVKYIEPNLSTYMLNIGFNTFHNKVLFQERYTFDTNDLD